MAVAITEKQHDASVREDVGAPRCAVLTLGCKVNQAETEEMRERFAQAGFTPVAFGEPAEVSVVNTCTVTHVADRKSRQMIRRAQLAGPHGVLVVTGCYAAVSPEEAAAVVPDALVVQRDQQADLVDIVANALQERGVPMPEPLSPEELAYAALLQPKASRTRSRVFVKVQDGCWHACAYCIVPRARGRSVSRPAIEIVERVQGLHAQGVAEVVLTGVCIGDYEDPAAGSSLTALIQRILDETDVSRVRISSINPMHFDYAFLELFAHPRICRHLHLPLQSGSPHILRRMNRRHTLEEYREIVWRAREICPELALTTDVLVGFPGETEEHFGETAAFIEEMAFADLHVFPYSIRPRTSAAHFDRHVPFALRKQRVQRLLAKVPALRQAYRERFLGSTLDVVWEEAAEGLWRGCTDNYLRVYVKSDTIAAGAISAVRLVEPHDDGVLGEVVDDAVRSVKV
ncbi:MAG: tRNA (N(6)-L-threonylcarbamoyladenosine(37)-C(2))-methylthiotransferase MtaB [Chloroflexota bacterium]|nr:tRNA (N(6)-L-threonylcarbamoyladenosine(37)-C(2))-methylthiotransferase MtaB [Chloroflexota bacterium]MDE2840824.1 tRNA (N(6)-L-threonylcarbamoyladenosine(37)-C(2))-methylthiotransferase MtaB [Chloroflexota bacterium]MDE2932091.1 tRNA (N(6)-L-threonylcarbamoyladenosine(37)-C(2))-methylthiotransferase MtaB [Chloroflexota bacterium]